MSVTKTPFYIPGATAAATEEPENTDFEWKGCTPPSYNQSMTESNSPDPQAICFRSSNRAMRFYAASHDNFNFSPLMRMPDKVLAKIMKETSVNDILRLRHVSRSFMRVFDSDPSFHCLQDNECTELAHVWATPMWAYPEQSQKSLCHECSQIRGARDPKGLRLLEDMPTLECVLCNEAHTEIHFSKTMRDPSLPRFARRCIGQEGRLKLCSHVSCSWTEAQLKATREPGSSFVCDDASHKTQLCPGKKCGCRQKPIMAFDNLPELGAVKITMISQTHVPFGKGPDGEKPLWFNFARDLSEALQMTDKQQFLPSRLFRSCNPMRAFDPNHCSCLDWDVLPEEEEDSPEDDCFKWRLADRNCGSWRDDYSPSSSEHGGATEASSIDWDKDRCYGARHGFRAKQQGRYLDIDFRKCRDDDSMLVLEQCITLYVLAPTDAAWEDSVDNGKPAGMASLDADDAMRGKTWCPDPACHVSQLKTCGNTLATWEHHRLKDATRSYLDSRGLGLSSESADESSEDPEDFDMSSEYAGDGSFASSEDFDEAFGDSDASPPAGNPDEAVHPWARPSNNPEEPVHPWARLSNTDGSLEEVEDVDMIDL